MKLLTLSNTKTLKGEKLGWRTFGLHLAPFNLSGFQVCPHASAGCAEACLNTAGRGIMRPVQESRIQKTRFFFADRDKFMSQLVHEITLAIAKCGRDGFNPCFRLNLTSDLPWESIKWNGKSLMEHFPAVRFYDYTKNPKRAIAAANANNKPQSWAGGLRYFHTGGRDWPKNYHLTFSRSECNAQDVADVLAWGGNVAVVFDKLPKLWHDLPVIDGDETDLRFLDPSPCVVGLKAKGKAKHDTSGFVVAGKEVA